MARDEHNRNARREVLKKVLRGAGLMGLGGAVWGGMAIKLKASGAVLRPPGAIEEINFIKACIRCGNCVEACPYDTLKLATPDDGVAIGTPYFTPRSIPCYMCPDVPCVPPCPSGALDVKMIPKQNKSTGDIDPDINKARMGVAMIDEKSCLAFWGIQCDACYRVCPLIGHAITLGFRHNERTGKHAILEPHIHNDVCTGCGLCEHACVTEKAAVFVLPRQLATGKVGDHYIKGWEPSDEERMKMPEESVKETNHPEDILNDWEDLLKDE
jgi:ferredoxin-type protein NapG